MSENYRHRNHALLLYPDDPTHVKAVEIIQQSFDFALILHDKDVYDKGDEELNPQHVAGTIKKPHWHVVLKFKDGVWRNALAKQLGIEANYIREVKKFDNALLYLIHYHDTDKAQYEAKEVKGNLAIKLRELVNKMEKGEGEKVYELITWLENDDTTVSVTDFAKYCALNGYWAEFRRSGAIFCKIIEEHNKSVVEKYSESIE